MFSPRLSLQYPRHPLTSNASKPVSKLFIPLFVAPFIALSLLISDIRQNSFQSSSPKLTSIKTKTLNAIAKPLKDDGYPPPNLPPTHPHFHLLNTIRRSCQITPRWPKYFSEQASLLRTYGPAYSSIIVSHKLKIIYVPVFKVGTTSMMWHIAYLENNPHVLRNMYDRTGALDLVLHDMNSEAWQNHTLCNRQAQDIQLLLEDPSYLKFGFVRNPFDRIISAYLDKIATLPIHSKEYQKQTWSLYGNDFTKRAEANTTKPSFPQFLQRVAQVLRMPRTPTTDLRDDQAYEDNFSRRDMHWRPQVELLHPDLIHLDFVGRFDNFEQDRNIVLEWMYRHTDRRMPVEAKAKLHATNPSDKIRLYELLRHDEKLQRQVVDTFRQDFDTFHFPRHVPQRQ